MNPSNVPVNDASQFRTFAYRFDESDAGCFDGINSQNLTWLNQVPCKAGGQSRCHSASTQKSNLHVVQLHGRYALGRSGWS